MKSSAARMGSRYGKRPTARTEHGRGVSSTQRAHRSQNQAGKTRRFWEYGSILEPRGCGANPMHVQNLGITMIRSALVCSTLICPVMVSAQEFRASITGRAMDQSGAVIPNASIVVTNTETGVRADTKSDQSGIYT